MMGIASSVMLQVRKHDYVGNAERKRQDVLLQDGSLWLPPYGCAVQTAPKENVAITDDPQAGLVVLFRHVVQYTTGDRIRKQHQTQ